ASGNLYPQVIGARTEEYDDEAGLHAAGTPCPASVQRLRPRQVATPGGALVRPGREHDSGLPGVGYPGRAGLGQCAGGCPGERPGREGLPAHRRGPGGPGGVGAHALPAVGPADVPRLHRADGVRRPARSGVRPGYRHPRAGVPPRAAPAGDRRGPVVVLGHPGHPGDRRALAGPCRPDRARPRLAVHLAVHRLAGDHATVVAGDRGRRSGHPVTCRGARMSARPEESTIDAPASPRTSPRSPRARRTNVWSLVSVVSVAAGIALWWLLSVLNPVTLPSPVEVAVKYGELIADGTLADDIGASLGRVLLGFAIGAVIAIPIGVVMGWYRPVRALIEPWTQFFRMIPPLAIIPMAIVLMGIGEVPKVFVIALASFLVSIVATFQGVLNIDRTMINAGRVLGA